MAAHVGSAVLRGAVQRSTLNANATVPRPKSAVSLDVAPSRYACSPSALRLLYVGSTSALRLPYVEPARTVTSLLEATSSSFDRALLVFEDLGDVLSPQAPMEHVDTNAVLLNLSDGLLSLLVDVVVIPSFNTQMEQLNPALLRPGSVPLAA